MRKEIVSRFWNKSVFFLLVIFGQTWVGVPLFAQAAFPDPSPQQKLDQDFGMSSVTLTYSRPGVKGRRIIGNVEPFDSVWRAGANKPTLIHTREPLLINHYSLDSGVYALYIIPRKNYHWTVVLNRGTGNWGSDNYSNKLDALRIPVKAELTKDQTESLTYSFENIRNETMDLVVSWEHWRIRLFIQGTFREALRQQIDNNLRTESPTYWFAAQFYYEYEKDFPKALQLIQEAINRNEKAGMKPYWQYHYKARILRDLGRKEESRDAARVSYELARQHGNRNNYLKLNEELINSLEGRGDKK